MKPWLWIPPKLAHDLSAPALKLYGSVKPYKTLTWEPFTWRKLEFHNPLGIAGGVDKNGELFKNLWCLGPGFVEVGTVTPLPQEPNPGKILDRDTQLKALWNCMGFPNKGVEHVKQQLQSVPFPHHTPIFVNIGKNRQTHLTKAIDDYKKLIQSLYEYADAFVLNISSPNTKGLRELFNTSNLDSFLSEIIDFNKNLKNASKPLLLKLSPDLDERDLERVLEVSFEKGIDGWILTNTTTNRTSGMHFPQTGGVSGAPLQQKSKRILSHCLKILGPRREGKLIVSVGGVLTAEDVFERLEMGADLVQVYSALIFSGPQFFTQVSAQAQHHYIF